MCSEITTLNLRSSSIHFVVPINFLYFIIWFAMCTRKCKNCGTGLRDGFSLMHAGENKLTWLHVERKDRSFNLCLFIDYFTWSVVVSRLCEWKLCVTETLARFLLLQKLPIVCFPLIGDVFFLVALFHFWRVCCFKLERVKLYFNLGRGRRRELVKLFVKIFFLASLKWRNWKQRNS